jgi:hypothetical protein
MRGKPEAGVVDAQGASEVQDDDDYAATVHAASDGSRGSHIYA